MVRQRESGAGKGDPRRDVRSELQGLLVRLCRSAKRRSYTGIKRRVYTSLKTCIFYNERLARRSLAGSLCRSQLAAWGTGKARGLCYAGKDLCYGNATLCW
jgi:hypothetical protein